MHALPELSIVIPTLNEREGLPLLLADLAGLRGVAAEVVVADGGSTDGTPELAGEAGATVVSAPRGRGRQLRAGIAAAQAPLLAMIHADVRLPPVALVELAGLARARAGGAPRAFRLGIAGAGWAFRLVEHGANLRSRWLRLPYGDQGLVISRALYDQAGGYPDVPLMEDVALARALARFAPITLLASRVLVSPRRWERDGVWRRSAHNLTLLARYLAGARPESLVAAYERTGNHQDE